MPLKICPRHSRISRHHHQSRVRKRVFLKGFVSNRFKRFEILESPTTVETQLESAISKRSWVWRDVRDSRDRVWTDPLQWPLSLFPNEVWQNALTQNRILSKQVGSAGTVHALWWRDIAYDKEVKNKCRLNYFCDDSEFEAKFFQTFMTRSSFQESSRAQNPPGITKSKFRIIIISKKWV